MEFITILDNKMRKSERDGKERKWDKNEARVWWKQDRQNKRTKENQRNIYILWLHAWLIFKLE